MRVVYVSNLEGCTVTGQTAGTEGGHTALVRQLSQRVVLVHELRKRRRTEELLDGCGYRTDVDQRLRRNHVEVLNGHALTDNTLHAGEADAELVLQQLAYAAQTAVAQMVDIVNRADAVTEVEQIADGSEHILHARLDDKDHMVKARANRVIDGILHQNLAVRTQTVHLLVSAVAGTHARSHNQKRCTHSHTSSSSNNRLILTYYTGFALFLQPQSPKFMKP